MKLFPFSFVGWPPKASPLESTQWWIFLNHWSHHFKTVFYIFSTFFNLLPVLSNFSCFQPISEFLRAFYCSLWYDKWVCYRRRLDAFPHSRKYKGTSTHVKSSWGLSAFLAAAAPLVAKNTQVCGMWLSWVQWILQEQKNVFSFPFEQPLHHSQDFLCCSFCSPANAMMERSYH